MTSARTERDRHVDLILREVDRLPTLSPIAAKLIEASASEEVDLDELIGLMESDPAMSATILKLCRSAEKGLADRITSVRRAVVMLGLETVRSVALGVEVIGLLRKQADNTEPGAEPSVEPVAGFDERGFWTHSIAVACAAEQLARLRKSEVKSDVVIEPDQAFLAGLLHGLGRMVLRLIVPAAYDKILAATERKHVPSAAVERAVLGLDHHTAGRHLGRTWHLPNELIDVIWFHDQPIAGVPASSARYLTALITLARTACRQHHLGWSGDWHPPAWPKGEIDLIGLAPERITSVVPRIIDDVSQRSAILGIDEQTTPELLASALAGANRTLAGFNRALSEQARRSRRREDLVRAASLVISARPRSFADAMEVVGRSISMAMGKRVRTSVWRFGRDATVRRAHHADDGTLSGVVMLPASEMLAGDMCAVVDEPGIWAGFSGLEAVEQGDWSPLREAWACVLVQAAHLEQAAAMEDALAGANRALGEMQVELAQQQSLARLGEMAAGAAHEMNNPLAVIRGRAQLLALSAKDSEQQACAKAIEEAAVAISALISDLHRLGVPERSEGEVSDVGGVIEAALRAVAAAGQSIDRVVVESRSGELGWVADRELSAAALAEVIVNALEAGSDESVRISADVEGADGRIYVRVADRGRGMSERAMQHAFDPFFSEKPAGRQRGLGLARAKRCLDVLGGRMWFEHRDGGGTLAIIEFPAARKAAA